jgi:SAM-dependent methyltransferase
MMPFKKLNESMIKRINRLQRERFDELVDRFEPPLPEGVPERLSRIVAAANIQEGETVLDVGTGTGILIPLIQRYRPGVIYACDLSEGMLKRLREKHAGVETLRSDVRDLELTDDCLNVVLINACYPNIADKAGTFENLSRMIVAAGRLIISHPLGKQFIAKLKENADFPLDDLPTKREAESLFWPYGFRIDGFIDEPQLYILSLSRPATTLPSAALRTSTAGSV